MITDRLWLTSTVVGLCERFLNSADQRNRDHTIKPDFDILPQLADALEEAGCDVLHLIVLLRCRICVSTAWMPKTPQQFLENCMQMADRFFEVDPVTLINAAKSRIRKGEFLSVRDDGSCVPNGENFGIDVTNGVALEDAEPGETVFFLPTKKPYST